MSGRDLLIGSVVTVVLFGTYLLGGFQEQRSGKVWRNFFASCVNPLSRQGFLWAIAVPMLWLTIFYAQVIHVWFALGRWPAFGEDFTDWALTAHSETTWHFAGALLLSVYAVPLVAVGCLFFPRYRHVSVYSLTFAAAVGLAFGAMQLAPGPFLNLFFD
jgi:hypothetical protein